MAKLRAWQLWMTNATGLIQTGLYTSLVVTERKGVFVTMGEYSDGGLGAPLAKYSEERTARHVAGMINRKAGLLVLN